MKVKGLIDVFYKGRRHRAGTVLDVPDDYRIAKNSRMFEVYAEPAEPTEEATQATRGRGRPRRASDEEVI